jgi:hypothetical protein
MIVCFLHSDQGSDPTLARIDGEQAVPVGTGNPQLASAAPLGLASTVEQERFEQQSRHDDAPIGQIAMSYSVQPLLESSSSPSVEAVDRSSVVESDGVSGAAADVPKAPSPVNIADVLANADPSSTRSLLGGENDIGYSNSYQHGAHFDYVSPRASDAPESELRALRNLLGELEKVPMHAFKLFVVVAVVCRCAGFPVCFRCLCADVCAR